MRDARVVDLPDPCARHQNEPALDHGEPFKGLGQPQVLYGPDVDFDGPKDQT